MLLLDLSDDRRSSKPWLPESDRDVTEGRVVKSPVMGEDGRPYCVQHGAMHSVALPAEDEHRIYRCSDCGVGAVWYPTNCKVAKKAFSAAWDAKYEAGLTN